MGLFGVHNHTWAGIIGGFFAFLAILTSFYQIYRHAHFNHNKYIRRYIVRILLMVPVYAIESWFGILYPGSSVYLNAIRDIYEAITVYSFYQLLVNSLGGFRGVSVSLQQSNEKQEFPHMFPFKYCCKPWKFIKLDFGFETFNNIMDQNINENIDHTLIRKQSSVFHYRNPRSNPFFRNCTLGVLQYCFCEIFCCLIIFILQFVDRYGEGEYKLTVAYPYFVVILSLSQSWAIYCLVLFYYSIKNIHNDTDGVYIKFIHMKPVLKFLCIKGVVFFTYWQSIGIGILVFVGFIHDDMMNSLWTADNIANSLQDFIICIEMFGFAIAHHFAFNPLHFQFDIDENKQLILDPQNNKLIMLSSNVSKIAKTMIDAVNVTDIARNANDVVDLKNSKAVQVLNPAKMVNASFGSVDSQNKSELINSNQNINMDNENENESDLQNKAVN